MSAPVPSPAPTAEQEHVWMGLALRAARAAGAAGDVPIGAALVAGDGTVLAVVGNEREQHHDPTATPRSSLCAAGRSCGPPPGRATAGA